VTTFLAGIVNQFLPRLMRPALKISGISHPPGKASAEPGTDVNKITSARSIFY